MTRLLTIFLVFICTSTFSQEKDSIDKFVHRTTILSTIIPGSGHIHNLKIKPSNKKSNLWWKLPVIYGGISAAAYSFFFNQNEYKLILNERLARQDGASPSYMQLYSSNDLKIIQGIYGRRRDLSFIAFLGIYALQIIDSNVEAHLFLFDDNDDLSLTIKSESNFNYSGGFTPMLSLTYNF